MIQNKDISKKRHATKNFPKRFLNPVSHSLAWHIKHLQNLTFLLVVPLQIQAINPLIFRAQTLDVFLRGLYVFY